MACLFRQRDNDDDLADTAVQNRKARHEQQPLRAYCHGRVRVQHSLHYDDDLPQDVLDAHDVCAGVFIYYAEDIRQRQGC